MKTLFYEDPSPTTPLAASIFLAGPTSTSTRTDWREIAIARLSAKQFTGTVIVPEFRDGTFAERVPDRFGSPPSQVPGMRDASYNILVWETNGIERVTVVLFWMPFVLDTSDDHASLPGFTTRAEVSREIVRDPRRIVLGMPMGALSASHIRFHAHRAGLQIEHSLAATIDAALVRVQQIAPIEPHVDFAELSR